MAPARQVKAAQPEERRAHQRYPVGLNLRYKLSRSCTVLEEGYGTTRDMSAGGVFLYTDHPLPEGSEIELFMNWPVQIQGTHFLRLNMAGRIVRSLEAGIAVKIAERRFSPLRITAG